MADFQGSQTEQNLMKAFAGESQARNRYTYYASVAREEGYMQMAYIFELTANQEKEHAKRIFKFFEGGTVEITDSYPAGTIGTTLENLQAAAAGEEYEYSVMYPAFAQTAEEEGFPIIASTLRAIAVAEQRHYDVYKKLSENIELGKVFLRNKPIFWQCRNCGFVYEGTEPPDLCPACQHPKAYFEVMMDNF